MATTAEGEAREQAIVIRFDCEWPFDRVQGPGKIATIQVAFKDNIYVYHVSHLTQLPQPLLDLLKSPMVLKIGKQVNGDLRKIERDFGVKCNGGRELGMFCKKRGAISNAGIGLSAICAKVLGRALPKEDQVRYALAALEVYNRLKHCGVTGERVSQLLAEGTRISFNPGSDTLSAAYGEIAKHESKFDRRKVTRNRAIILVKQVNIPGAVDAYEKSLSEHGPVPFKIVAKLTDLHNYTPVEVHEPAEEEHDVVLHEADNNNGGTVAIHEATESNSTSSDSEDDDYLVTCEATFASCIVKPESREYGEATFSSLPKPSESEMHDQPIRSRVLKDAFHLMDMIRVPRKHGLAADFTRKLRDVLFIIDDEDKRRVEAVLLRQGTTWNKMLLKNSSWIFRQVKRKEPLSMHFVGLLSNRLDALIF
ncbi:ribonuclease H-like domain-containing protein [Fennellomyces sp. T-0311]|nr:ribonuclease H-like domain-containing protein [Fennellomyces sp. T-0311]